jgi:hypothetical protein
VLLNFSQLRRSLVGLISFAAVEDALLLTDARNAGTQEDGSADSWAAIPLVAHNTEFKRQQVIRLRAIRAGKTPQSFADVDHRSIATYERYARKTIGHVVNEQRRVTQALVEEIVQVSDDDLTEPARNPWLRGRQLWLQIVVRGFWHPLGHAGEYYLEHSQPDRALALHTHAVATAQYLDAPPQARGMALYSLACVEARLGLLDEAAANVRSAVALNADLREKAASDPDLIELRAALSPDLSGTPHRAPLTPRRGMGNARSLVKMRP